MTVNIIFPLYENTFSFDVSQESQNIESQSPEPKTTSTGNDQKSVCVPVSPHKVDEKNEVEYSELANAQVNVATVEAPSVVDKHNDVPGFKNPEVSIILVFKERISLCDLYFLLFLKGQQYAMNIVSHDQSKPRNGTQPTLDDSNSSSMMYSSRNVVSSSPVVEKDKEDDCPKQSMMKLYVISCYINLIHCNY